MIKLSEEGTLVFGPGYEAVVEALDVRIRECADALFRLEVCRTYDFLGYTIGHGEISVEYQRPGYREAFDFQVEALVSEDLEAYKTRQEQLATRNDLRAEVIKAEARLEEAQKKLSALDALLFPKEEDRG